MDNNKNTPVPEKKNSDVFSDNEKLFTDKTVDDELDFFDIDAHRKERQMQPGVEYAKRTDSPVKPASTPRKIKVVSSGSGVKKVQSSANISNTDRLNPQRITKPVNNVNPNHMDEKAFEAAYGKKEVLPEYLMKKEKIEREQQTAEYDAIFTKKEQVNKTGSAPAEKTVPTNSALQTKNTSDIVKTKPAEQKFPKIPSRTEQDNKDSQTRAFPKIQHQNRDGNAPIAFKVSTPPVQERVKNKNTKKKSDKPEIPGVVKALIYLGSVFLISVIAAVTVISVSNDVFSFVKEDTQIDVAISENATLKDIADVLYTKKVIKYPNVFVLWSKLRHNDDETFLSGTFTVTPTQNYDELLKTFMKKSTVTQYTEISVTIPEGYTVDEIITLFVDENGVGTREGFIDAIQNHEYDFWFVKELTDLDPDRKYRLEGYLYPDTYYIYKEWEEWRVINKILANFYNKFSKEYKAECEALGYSVDDIVNIASIIQMESMYPKEYTVVSSVIHNRLNSGSFRYMLECCSTVQYILPERVKRLSAADTQIDNQYNSYLYPGLPPGPISNPTMQAIRAALYPEDTNYYYFVARDDDGTLMFAKTLAEHNANKAAALTD